jgi:hypothetical protein
MCRLAINQLCSTMISYTQMRDRLFPEWLSAAMTATGEDPVIQSSVRLLLSQRGQQNVTRYHPCDYSSGYF